MINEKLSKLRNKVHKELETKEPTLKKTLCDAIEEARDLAEKAITGEEFGDAIALMQTLKGLYMSEYRETIYVRNPEPKYIKYDKN